MVQKLLSGSAPFLTQLKIVFHRGEYSEVNGQIDPPSLKQLDLESSFNFFVSFKGCKNLETIKYSHAFDEEQWSLVKHLLFTCTWPKLLVLNLCSSYSPRTRYDPIRAYRSEELIKKDVDTIWDSCRIKLLLD